MAKGKVVPGLDALFGALEETAVTGEIPIDQIQAGANPRKTFDETSLQELADSLREHGVLQPVLLARDNGGYLVVAGERRWRAAKLAGLKAIPAVVRELDQQQRLVLAMVENLQREDLNVIDRAAGLDELKAALGTWDSVARATGLATRSVLRLVTLNGLTAKAKTAVSRGNVAASAAAMLVEHLGARAASAKIEEATAQLGGMTREQAEEILRDPNSDTASSPHRVRRAGARVEDVVLFHLGQAHERLRVMVRDGAGTYRMPPEDKERLVNAVSAVLDLVKAVPTSRMGQEAQSTQRG